MSASAAGHSSKTPSSSSSSSIPILLLKTKSTPHDGYEEYFSAAPNGTRFSPTFVPVLEHRILEPGLDTVRQLLLKRRINTSGDKDSYGGMIFTSQRAVEAFAKLLEEGALPLLPPILPPKLTPHLTGPESSPQPSPNTTTTWPHLSTIPIYTVGPATTRALLSLPCHPPLRIFGADTGNGAALARYMLAHYRTMHPAASRLPPVLFCVGETRRDIIPTTLMADALPEDERIAVTEVEVYGTGVMGSFEQDFAQRLRETRGEGARWVVVFSPTGCEAALRALGVLDLETGRAKAGAREGRGKVGTYVATIGPTTRDYLRETFGFEPDVCAECPSPEGVGEAIGRFMAGL